MIHYHSSKDSELTVSLIVSPMDYDALMSVVLMFDACQRGQCTQITINNDGILEERELFFANLERPGGLDSRISLNPVQATIEIIDADGM